MNQLEFDGNACNRRQAQGTRAIKARLALVLFLIRRGSGVPEVLQTTQRAW